jgi:hypothetical protein
MAQLFFYRDQVVAGIVVRCPKATSDPSSRGMRLCSEVWVVERRIVEACALNNGGRDNLDLVHW